MRKVGGGASLSSLLDVRGVGPDAWKSPRFRAAVKAIDVCGIVCTLALNIQLYRAKGQLFGVSRTHQILPGFIYVSVSLVQFCCSQLFPDSYFRHRNIFMVANRLVRLSLIFPYLIATRHQLFTPYPAPHHAPTAPPAPQLPSIAAHNVAAIYHRTPSKPFATFALTMALSGNLLSLAHSIVCPLPLLPQALLQTLYLLLLTLIQGPPAAALLSLAPTGPHLQALCDNITDALSTFALDYSGGHLDVPSLRSGCAGSGPLTLLVALNIYFTLLAPMYVAYRVDQHLRRSMQPPQQWPRQAAPAPGCPQRAAGADADGPCGLTFWDLAGMVGAVAGCWLLSVALQPVVVRLAWPVHAGHDLGPCAWQT